MEFIKKYWAAIIFFLLGVVTLIPVGSGTICYAGYYAYCTFTPFSTLILWGVAWFMYWKISKKSREENKTDKK